MAPKAALRSATSMALSSISWWNAITAPAAKCWRSHRTTGADARSAPGPASWPSPIASTPASRRFNRLPVSLIGSTSDETASDSRHPGWCLDLLHGTLRRPQALWRGDCPGHAGTTAVKAATGRGRRTGARAVVRERLQAVLDARPLGRRGTLHPLAKGAGKRSEARHPAPERPGTGQRGLARADAAGRPFLRLLLVAGRAGGTGPRAGGGPLPHAGVGDLPACRPDRRPQPGHAGRAGAKLRAAARKPGDLQRSGVPCPAL